MKKRLSIFLSTCIAILMVSGCGSSQSTSKETEKPVDDEVYTLHAAYSVAENPNSQHTIKFNKFKELVEGRTNGKVQIVIHPGGELGSEKEYVEMLQNGELAFASTATSVLSGFSPALAFYDCPFLFKTQEQVIEFSKTDIAEARLKQLEDIGILGLAATSIGSRNFLTVKDKPISSINDIKGMKIRTMQNELQINALSIIGADPAPIAYSECYQSMQTGVIDGMENEVDTYLAMKFYEVAPNYTKVNWLQLVHTFLASKDIIESLPKEYQDIIAESALEAANYSTEKGIEYQNTEAKKALKEANVNVIELDNKDFNQSLVEGGFFEKYKDTIGDDVLTWLENN